MIKIGCHVSNNGDSMLLGSVSEALSYDANCFMVYLGAPQNSIRKPISLLRVEDYQKVLKEKMINNSDVIVHAPYIVNLAQPDNEKRKFAVDFISSELKTTSLIGASFLVVHPGAHVSSGINEALDRIILSIKEILEITKEYNSVICLETMAGKGTECCSLFEEVAYILKNINSKRVKVCLDTCHIWDAGYDIVNDYEKVINELDKTIGIDNIKVIHLNDSKNQCGSHKDRHSNIGFGYIGFDTLNKILFDERFVNVAKILETPFVDKNGMKVAPYKEEIKMLKDRIFNPNFIELL